MLKILFMLHEQRPSIQIKRLAEKISYFQKGCKDRRKMEDELEKLNKEKPVYKP